MLFAIGETEPRSYLGWVVLGSFTLHVIVVTALPTPRRVSPMPRLASMIVLAEPPASPPPPEPTAVPDHAPSPAPRAAHAIRAAAAPVAATAVPASPLDFTSTVFSNGDPGMAIGGGDGRVVAGAAPAIEEKAAPPRAVAIVPPSSLARKPRAPGLDVELERQYPPEARRSGVSGTAVLRVRILPDGRTGDVRIQSESWRGFGPACERTVRAGRWEPPIDHDGHAVTTEITYTCRFEIRS